MTRREEVLAREGSTFPGQSYAQMVLEPAYNQAKLHLLHHMLAIHKAHLVMLAEEGLVSQADAQTMLDAIRSLDLKSLAAAQYDGHYEDLFFQVEGLMLQRAGEVAGNLHIARSRNDMGVTLYRMALRERILDLEDALLEFHATLLDMAGDHADTVMLAYTHTQQAQPTTLGHWLEAAGSVLGRDIERLQEAYALVNRSPMGAAALGTSGFLISRERVANLLGFDGLVENSYEAVGSADYLTVTASAAMLAALHTGRVIQDFLTWGTQEFGIIRVGAPYVQISSIMPQKRNPVSLEHCRALLSRSLGETLAVLQMVHNTPFGDIVDTEDDLQPVLWHALETAGGVFRLLAAVLATLEVDRARLLETARASYANMTELADTLVRDFGLPFRRAHQVVATLVEMATDRGIEDVRDIRPELVDAAAQQVLGRPLGMGPDRLRQALDPDHFVRVRRVPGGIAPEETRRMLESQRELLDRLTQRASEARQQLGRAQERLGAACQGLAKS